MIDLHKSLEDEKINLVFLQFCDIFGNVHGEYIPKNKLEEVSKNGLSFDGSSINCLSGVKKSDKKLKVDKKYAFLLPNNILTFFCDINSKYDSRKNLKKIQNKFKKKGYSINVGCELEFYLFDRATFKANLTRLENLGYFSEISTRKINFLNEVQEILNEQNFAITTIHHECGKNQYELNFKFSSPLQIADKVTIIKQILKKVAKKYDLYISFMPKPIKNLAGSAMHINISLNKNNKNVFFDKNMPYKLSALGFNFVKGIQNHIGAICAFSNPTVNSYKRLNAKIETPTDVRIGYKDRRSCFRVPEFNENSARIELRFPDISCEIYLTLTAILISAYEEIFNKERTYEGIKKLPKNLQESLNFLKIDKKISNLVPKKYITLKEKIIADYESEITTFEIEKYL